MLSKTHFLSRLINEVRKVSHDPEMDTVIATVQVDQELTDIKMVALGSPNARKLLRKETQISI